MNFFRYVLILAAFVLMVGCASEDQTSITYTTVSNEISLRFDTEKLVGAWVDMWNTYDLSQVDKLFLTTENVTYFSSEKEGLIIGIDAVRQHHVGFGFVAGGKIQENKLWIEDLHTEMYGPVAVVNGIWYFEKGPADNRELQKGPVTIVYAPTDDGYRIAHMHFANYEEPAK